MLPYLFLWNFGLLLYLSNFKSFAEVATAAARYATRLYSSTLPLLPFVLLNLRSTSWSVCPAFGWCIKWPEEPTLLLPEDAMELTCGSIIWGWECAWWAFIIGWSIPLEHEVVTLLLEIVVPPNMRFPPLVTLPFDRPLFKFDRVVWAPWWLLLYFSFSHWEL